MRVGTRVEIDFQSLPNNRIPFRNKECSLSNHLPLEEEEEEEEEEDDDDDDDDDDDAKIE